MKLVAIFAVICCAFFLQGISAVPVADLVADEPDVLLAERQSILPSDEVSIRQKRATCDLLSGFGVGSSACAAHCMLRGNRGGYCNSQAVCVCRN